MWDVIVTGKIPLKEEEIWGSALGWKGRRGQDAQNFKESGGLPEGAVPACPFHLSTMLHLLLLLSSFSKNPGVGMYYLQLHLIETNLLCNHIWVSGFFVHRHPPETVTIMVMRMECSEHKNWCEERTGLGQWGTWLCQESKTHSCTGKHCSLCVQHMGGQDLVWVPSCVWELSYIFLCPKCNHCHILEQCIVNAAQVHFRFH